MRIQCGPKALTQSPHSGAHAQCEDPFHREKRPWSIPLMAVRALEFRQPETDFESIPEQAVKASVVGLFDP